MIEICNFNLAGSVGRNATDADFPFEEQEKIEGIKKDMSYRQRRRSAKQKPLERR